MFSRSTTETAFVAGVLTLYSAAAFAQGPTPLDAPLTAGETALIAAPAPTPEGHRIEAGATVPVLHYRLHLPADYHDGQDKSYPVMFIAAPGGNAKMGPMRDILERDRWIVAMMVESRNGSNIWVANFAAAYNDLMQRARVQKTMLFCTGMSGAAKVCSVYPQIRPGFRGMILQAAGPWGHKTFRQPANAKLIVYGTFGTHDPNFYHARSIRVSLPDGVRRMVEIWQGGHSWAPAEVFSRALDWTTAATFDVDQYDPALDEAYRWRISNQLTAFETSDTAIERHVLAAELRSAMTTWHTALGEGLIARVNATLAAHPEASPPDNGIAAWQAWRQAMTDDEAGRGKDLDKTAAPYQQIVDQYPGTEYAKAAARRLQTLHWETGQYP